MSQPGPRISREKNTIRAMVDIYCRDHHPPDGWHRCSDCQTFLDYAHGRLDKCPFQEEKPVCSACPIHCYKPDLRRRAQALMRYAGPRMILYHPVAAIRHLLEEKKEPPPHPLEARKQAAARQAAEPAPRRRSMPEECLNVPFPPIS